jgi:hypothetical protein
VQQQQQYSNGSGSTVVLQQQLQCNHGAGGKQRGASPWHFSGGSGELAGRLVAGWPHALGLRCFSFAGERPAYAAPACALLLHTMLSLYPPLVTMCCLPAPAPTPAHLGHYCMEVLGRVEVGAGARIPLPHIERPGVMVQYDHGWEGGQG